MTEPVYKDDWLTILQGDARAVLQEMPEQSVNCVVTSPPYFGLRSYLDDDDPAKALEVGTETSPGDYVASMVEVFRGIRRVLRDDGTVWLNIGDSYASSATGSLGNKMTFVGGQANQAAGLSRPSKLGFGLAAKQLIGIPWRVAFALQEDGWYLRSDIIWSKPNGMPSSVTDRPTLSHEYMFLLTKNPTYYYDADAIREPHQPITLERIKYGLNQKHPDGAGIAVPPIRTTQVDGADDFDTATVTKGVMGERFANPLGRNKRTVWEVATVPYPDAHYAVFPPKLIEPCIKAGCPEGGVVLDPFAGSGTVGKVAQGLSRRAVLIDLNADYLTQQFARNAQVSLGL